MSNTVTISFSTISSAVTGFSCTVIGEGTFLLVTSNSESVKNAVSSPFSVYQTLGSASITFFDPIIYVGETAKFKIALSDTITQSYIDTSSSCTATLSPSGTDTINSIGYLDENSKIGSIVFNDISTKTLSITCTGDAGATSVTASATFKVYSRSGLIVSFPNIIKGTNNQVYQAKFGTRSNSALAPTSDITLAISTTTTAYLSLDTTSLNYLASA